MELGQPGEGVGSDYVHNLTKRSVRLEKIGSEKHQTLQVEEERRIRFEAADGQTLKAQAS